MSKTENGWSTIDGSSLDKSAFPGTKIVPVPGIRKGDVAVVLHEVGRRFNKEVAKLYSPGCWGWAKPIPIPGTNVISNHGSGTAIDLNAPSFPWKHKTMNAKQRAACREIVKDMDGVVRWGGDYNTFIDEMHFEIDASAAKVKKLVKKLQEKTMTPELINDTIRTQTGRDATEGQMENKEYLAESYKDFKKRVRSWPSYKNDQKRADKGTLNPLDHLPGDLRNRYPKDVVKRIEDALN